MILHILSKIWLIFTTDPLIQCVSTQFDHQSFIKYLEQTMKVQFYVAIIDRTVTYLTDNLGTIITPHKSKNEKSLPPYLRQRYNLYHASLLNTDCLLLLDKEIEDSTPATIRKHLDTIS